jgi:hypothetical protein
MKKNHKHYKSTDDVKAVSRALRRKIARTRDA